MSQIYLGEKLIASTEGSDIKYDENTSVKEKIDELNSNLTNVNIYVGDDGKLHFVDSEGADSVLPFSNKSDLSAEYFDKLTGGTDGGSTTQSKTFTVGKSIEKGIAVVCGGFGTNNISCRVSSLDLTISGSGKITLIHDTATMNGSGAGVRQISMRCKIYLLENLTTTDKLTATMVGTYSGYGCALSLQVLSC